MKIIVNYAARWIIDLEELLFVVKYINFCESDHSLKCDEDVV